ncbi:MAG: ROK family protein [Planctomycetes bacterium]|nr:ROK family protein [Planctomycetota bacterium]
MGAPTLAACYSVPAVLRTLAIDIGGSGLKAAVLDSDGEMTTERVRVDTPVGAPPAEVVAALVGMVRELPAYDRVATGFPGMVRNGIVLTAPNLGHDGWSGYPLAAELEDALGRPVRVANDADVQGLAVIDGRGVEMVITLGTGFGSGLYDNGRLCPHLELSHHRFRKGETYDEQLGEETRKRIGDKKWQHRVLRAIDNMRELTHFDRLFVGGGNARRLECELPGDVTIVDNSAGVRGGIYLFEDRPRG